MCIFIVFRKFMIGTFTTFALLSWLIFIIGYAIEKHVMTTLSARETYETFRKLNISASTDEQKQYAVNATTALAAALLKSFQQPSNLQDFPFYAFAVGAAICVAAAYLSLCIPRFAVCGALFLGAAAIVVCFAGAIAYPAAMALEKCAQNVHLDTSLLSIDFKQYNEQYLDAAKAQAQNWKEFSDCFSKAGGFAITAQLVGSVLWSFSFMFIVFFYQWNS
eukprot:TRINITY_DN681_c0_g1_i1.p1 TRINITY_DN681_c0_g1~~TRINITY_DN681_c0_g1_i1.p1  ORF type:complete len:220 (-),score=50.05 TRINITY_DN681_c0_g1_i1:269-928(-)